MREIIADTTDRVSCVSKESLLSRRRRRSTSLKCFLWHSSVTCKNGDSSARQRTAFLYIHFYLYTFLYIHFVLSGTLVSLILIINLIFCLTWRFLCVSFVYVDITALIYSFLTRICIQENYFTLNIKLVFFRINSFTLQFWCAVQFRRILFTNLTI